MPVFFLFHPSVCIVVVRLLLPVCISRWLFCPPSRDAVFSFSTSSSVCIVSAKVLPVWLSVLAALSPFSVFFLFLLSALSVLNCSPVWFFGGVCLPSLFGFRCFSFSTSSFRPSFSLACHSTCYDLYFDLGSFPLLFSVLLNLPPFPCVFSLASHRSSFSSSRPWATIVADDLVQFPLLVFSLICELSMILCSVFFLLRGSHLLAR
jgi:hypothetical protein